MVSRKTIPKNRIGHVTRFVLRHGLDGICNDPGKVLATFALSL